MRWFNYLFCLCRLSYHTRIKEILPESFAGFIPEKPEPDYKYAKEGTGKCVAYNLVYNILSY